MFFGIYRVFKKIEVYIGAALGGVILVFVNFISNKKGESSLIVQVGGRLRDHITLETWSHKSASLVITVITMALLGLIIAWIKEPKDKLESFLLGFTAFAFVSSLSTTPESSQNFTSGHESYQYNASSEQDTNGQQGHYPENSNNLLFPGSNIFISKVYAESSINSEYAKNGEFIFYIKGGKYQKVTRIRADAFRNGKKVGEHIFSGNRIVLNRPYGTYRLEILARTVKDQEFGFISNITITEHPEGAIVILDDPENEPEIEPLGVLGKLIYDYTEVKPRELTPFETYKQLGIYNSIQGSYLQAIYLYKKSLTVATNEEKQDESAITENYIAYAQFRLGEYQKAEMSYKQLYSATHTDAHRFIWINYMKTLCAQDRYTEAQNKLDDFKSNSHYVQYLKRDGEWKRYCGAKLSLANSSQIMKSILAG